MLIGGPGVLASQRRNIQRRQPDYNEMLNTNY